MSANITAKKYKILVFDLEPTPYKVDLWNAFADNDLYDIYVLYTTEKNWSPDGSHNYQELPLARFPSTTFHGKGVKQFFIAAFTCLSLLFRWRPYFVSISGYVHALPLLTILMCVIFRKKYAVHSDVFNNRPAIRWGDYAKQFPRNLIRKLIFRTCTALLVCGIQGRESAIVAGCNKTKIYDFPYVVDRNRILTDRPLHVPDVCSRDLATGKLIIFFSGRLIPRKGLSTLINAIGSLKSISDWVIWIEGSGPLLQQHTNEVRELSMEDRCRFLGFCQMSLHSWLVRNSNIVVVPSLQDSWGIVVDEAMQMGKVVITSDQTGSGADRVRNGENGLVFTAEDSNKLSCLLEILLVDAQVRANLGNSARCTAEKFTPYANVYKIMEALQLT